MVVEAGTTTALSFLDGVVSRLSGPRDWDYIHIL